MDSHKKDHGHDHHHDNLHEDHAHENGHHHDHGHHHHGHHHHKHDNQHFHDQHHDHDILHHADLHFDHNEQMRAGLKKILVIRPNSGLSGDICVAGLLAVSGLVQDDLNQILDELNLGHLAGRVALEPRMLDSITGVGLKVDLPDEHEHRTLGDIEKFFQETKISDHAKAVAIKAFRLVAEAEGAVHGLPVDQVHFHEVGALDSILDIGVAAVVFDRISPDRVICGPLPVCDGVIKCQHGLLPSPAPAVMKLLAGVPVVGLASSGETVTPTGIALLKAFDAAFGLWPAVSIDSHALVYGTRRLEGVPNGAIFVLGHGA